MARSPESAQRLLDKQLKELREIYTGLRKEYGPKSMVTAMNKVGAKARTQALRKVALIIGARVKDIRPRVRLRKASYKAIDSGVPIEMAMLGYAKPMPAIRLAYGRTSVQKARGSQVDKQGKPKRVRTGSSSGLGGLKIGKRFYLWGYITLIHKNQRVHALRRKQKATWMKRAEKWVRAPTEVIKIPLDKPMRQQFYPSMARIMKLDYEKEFDTALNFYMAKHISR